MKKTSNETDTLEFAIYSSLVNLTDINRIFCNGQMNFKLRKLDTRCMVSCIVAKKLYKFLCTS